MLRLLAAYNESKILFLGNWGPKWLVAFSILGALILLLTWLDLSQMRANRRRVLLALRALVLLLAIAFAAEPAMELRNVEREPNHVAVLVDHSASGQLPANARQTRQDILREQIANIDARSVKDLHTFDFYRFGQSLHAASQSTLKSLDATDPQTHILRALEQLNERYDPNQLGGAILLSDGADNATLASRVAPDQNLDENTKKLIERIGVPIHTIQIADANAIQDIAIKTIHRDDFAFVRNAVKIDVDIEVHGYERGTFPVRLRRDGEILQTRTLDITKDTREYTLNFEFVPEQIGKEIYSLDIPVDRDDAVPENNRDFFVLNVIRDKIRILQVVGNPSWDVRFLRQLFKNDPNVELVSFFILRNLYNLNRAPDSEMSLIPFPTHELFEEELGSFDLIVLQNFEFEPYGVGRYLKNIQNYVERGGGLLMLGGDESFASGGYGRTPVEHVLPIELPHGRSKETSIHLEHFQPTLTDAGRRHPITRMEFDPKENQNLWNSLPKMHGTNVVGKLKTGAIALATHPTLRNADGPMPVLAIQDQKKGRSMAFTVDSTWRWNYEWVLQGGSSRPYASFWNSAIRWLIRDPALNLLQLDVTPNVVPKGEQVDVEIRAFQADYSPAPNQEIRLTLRRQNLDDLIEGKNREEKQEDLVVTTDEQGRARWSVTPDIEAAWRVDATMDLDDSIDVQTDEIFLSIDRSDELRDVQPRNDLLEKIADASGGKFFAQPPRALEKLPFEPPTIQRVSQRKSIDVWSAPWVLVVFILLLALEWHLRRRWGRL